MQPDGQHDQIKDEDLRYPHSLWQQSRCVSYSQSCHHWQICPSSDDNIVFIEEKRENEQRMAKSNVNVYSQTHEKDRRKRMVNKLTSTIFLYSKSYPPLTSSPAPPNSSAAHPAFISPPCSSQGLGWDRGNRYLPPRKPMTSSSRLTWTNKIVFSGPVIFI